MKELTTLSLMKRTDSLRLSLIALFFCIVASLYHFDVLDYLNLASFKHYQSWTEEHYLQSPIRFTLAFCFLFTLTISLAMPTALFFIVIGGALFGTWLGAILATLSISLGSLTAFLLSRFVFREFLSKKYHAQLTMLNKKIEKDAFLYLLSIRFVPGMPLCIINPILGLTKLSASVFFTASAIGMFIPNLIYSNAGKHLSKIETIGDVFSQEITLSFLFLAILILSPKLIQEIKKKRSTPRS